MTITSEQRRLTPIEQAQAALETVQADISHLEREQHQLAGLRDAARRIGDEAEHERLSDLFRINNIALRAATSGQLPDAKQALAQAQNELHQAQRNALDTARAAQRYDAEIAELEQRLSSLKSQRAAAQQAATAAEVDLAALEPPTPAAPILLAPVEPAAVAASRPVHMPALTISGRGYPTTHFNEAGLVIDRSGNVLDPQPEPESTPARKVDPLAAQTAESLY